MLQYGAGICVACDHVGASWCVVIQLSMSGLKRLAVSTRGKEGMQSDQGSFVGARALVDTNALPLLLTRVRRDALIT